MPERSGGELLFGRYSREECGLPPGGFRRPEWFRTALAALALPAALLALGWLAGVLWARQREAWMAELPFRVSLAAPDEAGRLLALGRIYAAALPERPSLAANLALALAWTAGRSPRPAGYLGNAANLFAGLDAWRGDGAENAFLIAMIAADVYAGVGDYAKAFASLDRAAAALEQAPDGEWRRGRGLLLLNSRAYLLATAPEAAGRDARRALQLIQLALTSDEELPGGGLASESAALLDTLAAAWLAAGELARASQAQSLALGLADADGLDLYLRRYDEVSAPKREIAAARGLSRQGAAWRAESVGTGSAYRGEGGRK
ncbi:MAG: hypothetical protein LBU23_03505 [Planctomycetota bacterium]|jgi:hypothetical protein|nr:hypothetical protein [Planctomycetota bacterium]